jgi:hypothetical protein
MLKKTVSSIPLTGSWVTDHRAWPCSYSKTSGASAVWASVTVTTGCSSTSAVWVESEFGSIGAKVAQPAGFFFFFLASAGPAAKAPTISAADAITDRVRIDLCLLMVVSPPERALRLITSPVRRWDRHPSPKPPNDGKPAASSHPGRMRPGQPL